MLSQVSRRLVPKKSTTIIGCCGKAVFLMHNQNKVNF